MKRTIKNLCIAALAVGLLVPACKKEEEAQPEAPAPQEEAAPEETAEQEAPAEEAKEEETAEADAEEINEDNYVKAAFEVTCVNAQIEDPAKAKEIKEEVYARYGFSEESFNKAQDALKDRETVKVAVETRMERCNKELAEGLATAGAADAPEGEEKAEETEEKAEAKKAPAPVPAKTGQLKDRAIKAPNFENAELNLNVQRNFKVSGHLKGKHEGRAFIIPVSGEVTKNGALKVSGKKGQDTVDISGKLSKDGAKGVVKGSIHQKNYSTRFSAK